MAVFSEKRVVASLRAGDRRAFAEVYGQYKGDVLGLATAMLGSQDGAWDVLHDVFIALARAAPRLAHDTNLKGYLLTAAANRARNRLTAGIRRMVDGSVLAEVPSSTTEDPGDIASRHEEMRRAQQALMALPQEQRTVVALRVYGGMPFRQIAASEGIPENTAQSRYRYGIEKIRRACQGGAS